MSCPMWTIIQLALGLGHKLISVIPFPSQTLGVLLDPILEAPWSLETLSPPPLA